MYGSGCLRAEKQGGIGKHGNGSLEKQLRFRRAK